MTASAEGSAAYEAALARLPDAYALALRYTDAGTPPAEICRRLGIEPESFEPFLDLAQRKLSKELSRP
ncbi:MAG: hypothetical protein ACSLE6_20070 [Mycobacterium sp.]